MIYCRNFYTMLIAFFGIWLIGCGAEVPTEPGEEVVSEKWIEPKDIGKDYPVGEVKVGAPSRFQLVSVTKLAYSIFFK